MSFQLLPKSVPLNDLERRNGGYFALFQRIRVASGAHGVKFTFAISSPDEFLFYKREDVVHGNFCCYYLRLQHES